MLALALLAALHAWERVVDATEIDVPPAAALLLAAALAAAAALRATASTDRGALLGAAGDAAGAAAVLLWVAVDDPPGWRATAILAVVAVGLLLQAATDLALRAPDLRRG